MALELTGTKPPIYKCKWLLTTMAASTATVRYSAADRRRQILEAAVELFARQGFRGTSTRQIAERAAVNEAIIFRHFPSKEDLYWAVIKHKTQAAQGHESLRERLQRYSSDREFLSGLAREILDLRANDSTLSRLLLFSALENHRLSQRFFKTYVAEYFETVAEYIRERTQQGRFREVDPMLAARAFLGMVVYHSWVQELFGWKRYQDFDHKTVSNTLTDIWLAGMLPCQKGETELAKSRSNHRKGRRNNEDGREEH